MDFIFSVLFVFVTVPILVSMANKKGRNMNQKNSNDDIYTQSFEVTLTFEESLIAPVLWDYVTKGKFRI